MGGDALPLPDFSEVKNDSVPTDCENEKSSQLSDQVSLNNFESCSIMITVLRVKKNFFE